VVPDKRIYRAIARNLARVLNAPEQSREVRRAVRRMLAHFAFYWVDLFRFAQLPPERLRALVVGGGRLELEPIERLRPAGA
jgi:lauroyl/myristoyl acyltransferase